MINKNKKGLELIGPYTYIIVVTLIFVSFIGIIFFQAQIMDFLREIGGEAPCRTSVYLHAYSKLSGKDFIQNTKLDCPTRYKEVSKENEVLPTIANEAYKCWDDFGSGQLELFDHNNWEGEVTYCHVCSTINFKGNLEGNLPGFLEYVGKYGVGDKTYLELLYGVKFTENNMQEYKNAIVEADKNSVNLNVPLAIIFLYDKESKLDKLYTSGIGSLVGGAIGTTSIAYATITGALGIGLFPLTLGAGIITGVSVVGAYSGYLLGSDSSADWDAKILVVPYTKQGLNKLNCQRLPIKTE